MTGNFVAAIPADFDQMRDAVSLLLVFMALVVLPVVAVIAGWRRRRAMTPAEREREDREHADNIEDRHW